MPLAVRAFALVALLGLSGCFASARAKETCDPSLWDHVYVPERLVRQSQDCLTLEGNVVHLETETDGDLHIQLALPQADQHYLNNANRQEGKGSLIVEVICFKPAMKTDSAAACKGYTNRIASPNLGDRVRVTGTYVFDKNHGWMEIHPVTHLRVLQAASSPPR